MSKIKAVFNWSGGKDSAHALYQVLQSNEFEIVALLTTINHDTRYSTMHRIPVSLLQEQAKSIGIPLYLVHLEPNGGMEQYGQAMLKAVSHFKTLQVTHFIFGDIFLADLRKYREDQLRPQGIKVVEPLWGHTSEQIMHAFLQTNLKTMIVTTMATHLDQQFIGKVIDQECVHAFPNDMDINGENGEYHTFCFDGPIFKYPVPFLAGSPFKQSFDMRLDTGELLTHTYWFMDLQELKG